MENNWEMMGIDEELASASSFSKDFQSNAAAFEKPCADYLRHQMYAPREECRFSVYLKGKWLSHDWADSFWMDEYAGPALRQTDVVLLGSNPSFRDLFQCSSARPNLEWLSSQFEQAQFEDYKSWYFTYLVPYGSREMDGKELQVHHRKDCLPIFEQRLKALRPRFVLAFGKYAAGPVLNKKGLSTEKMLGSIYDVNYTCADGTLLEFKLIGLPSLMELTSGKQVTQYFRILQRQLSFFKERSAFQVLHEGASAERHRVYQHVEDQSITRHIVIDTVKELRCEVDRVIELAETDPKRRIIAVDMEWEGEYPEQPGAHLLTAQFSSAPGEATVMVISRSDASGETEPLHDKNAMNAIAKELSRLLTWHDSWRPRVGGHFLRADLPWLIHFGVRSYEVIAAAKAAMDAGKKALAEKKKAEAASQEESTAPWETPAEEAAEEAETLATEAEITEFLRSKGLLKDLLWSYMPAKTPEASRDHGGWDTSVMYHAVSEKDSYGLKTLAAKELGIPTWNFDLEKCIEAHKAAHKAVTGYGCVPDEILHPYAAWDADAARRLAELCMFGYDGRPALLDGDSPETNCWKPYWLAQRAALGFLEIETTGLLLDRPRFGELSDRIYAVYTILLEDFRRKMNWPDFNPSSPKHKQAVLFGQEFGTRYVEGVGEVPTLPAGARSIDLTPIYESRDRVLWEELIEEGANPLDDGFLPSTDKNVMNLLAQSSPEAGQLRDIIKLKYVLNGILSVPEEYWDSSGYHRLYRNGHYKFLRADGCVHSSLSQLKATGRASSSRPNLQNIGKSSEETLMRIMGYGDSPGDYADLLPGPMYLYPIRTMYTAPKDYLFMEADFTGAELAVMAWVSQDPTMMGHVRRNALPESDPDYYDIHSHVAVNAFRLDCEPTKKGLASIHKKHLRVASKAVAFGIPYGRGAAAIAFQLRAQGIQITKEEAKTIIDSYFELYPGTRAFLWRCKNAVINPGYVKTLFGRFRRFTVTPDTPEDLIAKMGREFCNAPIQGTVADAINVAIYNLIKSRNTGGLDFKIVMQIHDALLLQVHKSCAAQVYSEVLPNAMVRDNPIVVNGNAYHFAIETDMSVRWGEELTEPIAQSQLGMTLKELKGEI